MHSVTKLSSAEAITKFSAFLLVILSTLLPCSAESPQERIPVVTDQKEIKETSISSGDPQFDSPPRSTDLTAPVRGASSDPECVNAITPKQNECGIRTPREAVAQGNDQMLLAAASINEPSASRLETLTKEIAQKEVELLRLNTNFRIECTRVSKWKPWRLFVYNLGASSCSDAGITSITATRWHYWTRPKSMPRSTAMAGPICLLIGHCITLGGVMTETTLDLINDYKVRKKGFDAKTTHSRVLAIKGDLDRLLADRATLLDRAQDLTPSELELAKTEGTVLKDVRDLALSEYSQFFVRAHKFFGNRDTNSLMAMTAAGTGGFEGSLLGIISANKRQPRLVGPGGLGFLISGATIVATPPATRLVANLRGGLARKKIDFELDNITTKSVLQLDSDRSKLNQVLSRADQSERDHFTNISRRLTAYSKQSALFTAQNEMNANEKTLANKEFKERMLFAACIGGTKMSWGINLSNAGFRYHPRSILKPGNGKTKPKLVADPAPGKLFTKRVAIGATTYVPGTGLWILDTLQNRVRGEMRNHAMASQQNLPSSLLQERLDRVQEIDDVFNY